LVALLSLGLRGVPMNKKRVLHAVKNLDNQTYYTHGYPCGTWNDFPKLQIYQTRGAATRQLNKLKGRNNSSYLDVVKIEIREVDGE
jgi:hypothetical protein